MDLRLKLAGWRRPTKKQCDMCGRTFYTVYPDEVCPDCIEAILDGEMDWEDEGNDL